MEELRNESYKECVVRNSNINFLNWKAVRGQVEGREKTYVSRKFVWMSRSFKPESSVRTGRGQGKDLRKQEIQTVE